MPALLLDGPALVNTNFLRNGLEVQVILVTAKLAIKKKKMRR